RSKRDWSSDVCSSDLIGFPLGNHILIGVIDGEADACKRFARRLIHFPELNGTLLENVSKYKCGLFICRDLHGLPVRHHIAHVVRSEERRVGHEWSSRW